MSNMSAQRPAFNPDLVKTPKAVKNPPPKGPLTVSQVTTIVQRAIQGAIPATIHVVGEVSNFKRHSSGHLYFTLKDNSSELSCVMWRSDAARLKFDPEDGLEIIASGTVEVFERAGRYQLYTRKLEPKGVGALELAFRKLCEKLKREGLFDHEHKKPLPPYPKRIAIVTSPTGAAIADMIRTIQRRYPCVHVLIYPVRVQGDSASGEIASAIRAVNRNSAYLGEIDLMIVGRGGGSIEDLWAFNEEVVARAMFASKIPIISAVGHEVDFSVADLVADVRAATPTAAAELAVPELAEVVAGLDAIAKRIARATRSRTEQASTRVEAATHKAPLQDPLNLVRRREQVLDELEHRMTRNESAQMHGMRRRVEKAETIVQRIAPHAYLAKTGGALRDASHRLQWAINARLRDASQKVRHLTLTLPATASHRFDLARQQVHTAETVLGAVSHKSVLGRGFSITRIKKGGKVLRSIKDLSDRQRLITQLADGEVETETINIHQLELFDES
jgi:exodeoxyribonuclease VII large subunit